MKILILKIRKKKRAPLARIPSHVMRLAEELLPRKVHLFLEVLPRNPDHRDAENVIPDVLVAEPPVEIRLLRFGVHPAFRVEPVLIEYELNGRHSLGLVHDETKVTVRQGRGDELLRRPSPVELELPFRGHVPRHRTDAEKETAIQMSVDSACLLDPTQVVLTENAKLLKLVLSRRLTATGDETHQRYEAKQSFHCSSLLSRYSLISSRHCAQISLKPSILDNKSQETRT